MAQLRVRYQTLELEGLDIHLRTLWDTTQFQDDDGAAADLGICSASWPLFGVIWTSGRVLANLMVDFDVADKRVLEIGCGIALASLVLQRRAADITATDHHPAVADFLTQNVALNGGPPIPFFRTGWDEPDCGMGELDLIIGSDLLYERDHAASLSTFIDRHARAACDVVIVDPGGARRGRALHPADGRPRLLGRARGASRGRRRGPRVRRADPRLLAAARDDRRAHRMRRTPPRSSMPCGNRSPGVAMNM